MCVKILGIKKPRAFARGQTEVKLPLDRFTVKMTPMLGVHE
jgi:hypothetical protein